MGRDAGFLLAVIYGGMMLVAALAAAYRLACAERRSADHRAAKERLEVECAALKSQILRPVEAPPSSVRHPLPADLRARNMCVWPCDLPEDEGDTLIAAPSTRRTVPESEALIEAIRAFTVEAPDGLPNGVAELEFETLLEQLIRWPQDWAKHAEHLLNAQRSASRWSQAHAEEVRRLRIAAENFFGEDFRAPRRAPLPAAKIGGGS